MADISDTKNPISSPSVNLTGTGRLMTGECLDLDGTATTVIVTLQVLCRETFPLSDALI